MVCSQDLDTRLQRENALQAVWGEVVLNVFIYLSLLLKAPTGFNLTGSIIPPHSVGLRAITIANKKIQQGPNSEPFFPEQ